jgi:hypothetical protein
LRTTTDCPHGHKATVLDVPSDGVAWKQFACPESCTCGNSPPHPCKIGGWSSALFVEGALPIVPDPCPYCARSLKDPRWSHSQCMTQQAQEAGAALGTAIAQRVNEKITELLEVPLA